MPLYECEICNFSTIFRRNYTRHILTPKHKKRLTDSFSLRDEDKKKDYSSLSLTHKRLIFPENDSFLTHFSLSPEKKRTEKNDHNSHYVCIFCERSFSRKNNLVRHQKNHCKGINKKKNDHSDSEILLETVKSQSKQIDDLIDIIGSKPRCDVNINHTSIDNSKNINFHINNFGSENLEMLTNKFMRSMIDRPYTAIPKMIKKIHFNDKYPENKNIRMLNKKDNKLQIIENGKWTYVDKDETIDMLLGDNNIKLEDFYEKNKGYFTERQTKRYATFQQKIGKSEKEVQLNIVKGTDLVFWNHM